MTTKLVKIPIIYLAILILVNLHLVSCNESSSKEKNNSLQQTVNDTLTKRDSLKIAPQTILIDTSSQRILLIGDSMADGLGIPLAKYAKYNKHWFGKCSWKSSSIMYWAGSDTLRKVLNRFKPTFVLVSLGSNELFTTQLDAYKKYIKKIIEKIDTIPQVWIEPPVWKQDNGLTALMTEILGKKRLFMSEKLTLDRGSDKIHPTFKGYHTWADSLCLWIMKKSAKPIELKRPPENIYKKYVSFPGETIVIPTKPDTSKTKPKTNTGIQNTDSIKNF